MLELSRETFEFYAALIISATLFFIALIFSSQTTDSYLLIKSVVGQFGLISLLIIYILYVIYRRMIRFAFYQSYWPLIIYFVAVSVSLFTAVNGQIALQKTVELIIWLFLFTLLSQRKLPVRKLVYVCFTLILAGGLVAAYGILMRFGFNLFSEDIFAPISTLGNTDFTAEWLVPLIPLSVILAADNLKSFLSGLVLFCLVLMLVCLGLTKSWGSMVSLVVGCALVYRLTVFSPHIAGHKRAGLIGFLLLVFVIVFPSSLYYYQRDNRQLQSKLRVWQTTINLVKNHTLGVGRGNFVYAYPPYTAKERWLETEDEVIVRHVFNEYLETAAEAGIVGGLTFLAFILVIYNQLARYLRKPRENYTLAVGLGLSWLVMVLNGLVSFNRHNPATGMLFWFFSGSLVSLIEPAQQKKRGFDFIKDIRWGIYAAAAILPMAMLFYIYYPLAADASLKKAYQLYSNGDKQKAAVKLREAIKYADYNYQSHLLLGNILEEQGEIKKAIAEYRKALVLSPNFPDIHVKLGQLYHDNKEYDAAVKSYLKTLTINPFSLKALNNLGSLYAISNRAEAAEKVFLQALEINPQQSEIYFNLGNLMLTQERDDEAVVYYLKAIQLDPKKVPFHNNLGVVYKKNGRYELAVKEFNKVIKLDPNFVSAYNNFGNTLVEMKRYSKAINHYKKALAIQPSYIRAQFNLAYAYEQLGDTDRAVLEWRKIYKAHPETPEGKQAITNLIRLGKLKPVPIKLK